MVIRRRRSGFNLLEVTVSSLLVSILLISSMKTVGALVHRYGILAQGDIKLTLAHDLLSEIQHARFEDPDTTTAGLGPDAGETLADRSEFDDVDDYHNWTESAPTSKDGNILEGYSGYRRSVRVEFVEILNPEKTSSVATGLKRITIDVAGPDGRSVTLSALRGRYSPMDLEPGLRATYVRSVRVGLELENSSSSLHSGTSVLNQIAVEGTL